MPKRVFYTGGALDRAALQRRDADWVAERLAAGSTRIVPVWRNQNLILAGEVPEAVSVTGKPVRDLVDMAGPLALLGIDGDIAYFAADVSEHEPSVLAPLVEPAEFMDLRRAGALMDRQEGTLLAYARGMMHWHRRQQFCGDCGYVTESRHGGHMRACTNIGCGREHFPRTDPAVIMLVTRPADGMAPGGRDDVCLLGRQPKWADGMYSTLAGFVEPGESLEEAVIREVLEEAGVVVSDVRYRASQPWPFPSSLMLGFRARAETTSIDFDETELEDVRWFDRDEIARYEETGRRLPRPDSISRWLIEEWLAE
jgi:NAD+ diphosphatase